MEEVTAGSRNRYSCSHHPCTNVFEDLSEYMKHIKLHQCCEKYGLKWTESREKQNACSSQIIKEKSKTPDGLGMAFCEILGRDSDLNSEIPRYLTCWACKAQFRTVSELEYHFHRNHASLKPFLCSWDVNCGRLFSSLPELSRHMKICAKINPFRCSWEDCGKIFRTKNSLIMHRSIHTNAKPYKCMWRGCGNAFLLLSELNKHEKVHQKHIEYGCKWPECTEILSCCDKGNSLDLSLSRVDAGSSLDQENWKKDSLDDSDNSSDFMPGTQFKYCCRLCSKLHISISALRWHFRQDHNGEKLYKCSLVDCGKSFEKKLEFDKHIRSHSNSVISEKPYKCSWLNCDKAYRKKIALTNHRARVHFRNLPHKCGWKNCGKAFLMQDVLRIHMRTHTGEKPYSCHWKGCIKSFSVKCSRNEHYKSVHLGIRKIQKKTHLCSWSDCGKAFSNGEKLKRHERTHTGEKPYKCQWKGCNRAYRQKEGLVVHNRTHTGERPYKCPCGKAFITRWSLKKHTRCIYSNRSDNENDRFILPGETETSPLAHLCPELIRTD